jgi:hypothetical protein
MPQAEMPIFTRTFDFLTWLLPATNKFPRAQRHSFTLRRAKLVMVSPYKKKPRFRGVKLMILSLALLRDQM